MSTPMDEQRHEDESKHLPETQWAGVRRTKGGFHLPDWFANMIAGVILMFVPLFAVGAWRLSAALTHIERINLDYDRRLRETERMGLLNYEKLGQLETRFAGYEGWVKGKAGERYIPPPAMNMPPKDPQVQQDQ